MTVLPHRHPEPVSGSSWLTASAAQTWILNQVQDDGNQSSCYVPCMELHLPSVAAKSLIASGLAAHSSLRRPAGPPFAGKPTHEWHVSVSQASPLSFDPSRVVGGSSKAHP